MDTPNHGLTILPAFLNYVILYCFSRYKLEGKARGDKAFAAVYTGNDTTTTHTQLEPYTEYEYRVTVSKSK